MNKTNKLNQCGNQNCRNFFSRPEWPDGCCSDACRHTALDMAIKAVVNRGEWRHIFRQGATKW
jgi:hypothetical protein